MALSVQIQKRYGTFLLDACFETDQEFLALLGASGSGKSLTLKCIAGIETPDVGKIVLNDRVLFDSQKNINLPPQKRKVGYLFQQYALFGTMTVEKNIAVGIRGGCRAEKSHRVRTLMEQMELDGMEKKYPFQLSGGQQQRVALARILASQPEVILLDEPFSAIDTYLKWKLELELRQNLEGYPGSVVWVSHDRDEIVRNCGRVCVLHDGRTEKLITPKEMLTAPKTVSAAKLAGCKNILAVRVEGKTVSVPQWNLSLLAKKTAEGTQFIGIPAERVCFAEAGIPNAFACIVLRRIENATGEILILLPVGAAQNAPILRMDTHHKSDVIVGKSVTVSVKAEHILLLR